MVIAELNLTDCRHKCTSMRIVVSTAEAGLLATARSGLILFNQLIESKIALTLLVHTQVLNKYYGVDGSQIFGRHSKL